MGDMAAVTPIPQVTETINRGIVKQVLSGDSVIIRGQPKGGPPPERQINFSSVTAPRVARRATNNAQEVHDEPYGWESRDFLRQKIIGKEVMFIVDNNKSKALNRDYGTLFLGQDKETGENITELMVSEGWVSVRPESARMDPNLAQLEEQAKSSKKGKWAGDDSKHVRKVKWTVDSTRMFLEKYGGKKVQAMVEHVRDGSTVRCFLIPDWCHITLMLSGIRCPNVHMDGRKADPGTSEALGEQAKFFVESRLLQRDIHVVLETCNNNNLVGSVIHPTGGNIAEALLKEGFGKCVDWSMTTITGGPEKLRAAEKAAKEKRLRIWSSYEPPANPISDKEREFSGKVVEIVNSDAIVVQRADGKQKKIFLASIRAPKLEEGEKRQQSGKVFRPLYDIPHMYEAREFLRKKLIDQKVQVSVDYIQPPQANYPEKTCCTVMFGEVDVAEALVQRGLATVVRYRQDDDQRARNYDGLLQAEDKAKKSQAGLHAKKKDVPIRFRDLSDPQEAKKNFHSLKRLGKIDAVPEFVASGSRLRVFVAKETCIATFLLAGIQCPRAPRVAPGGAGGTIPGDAYGEEAYNFTRSKVLQRSVQIEVESMDKGGNFIGWLYYDNGAKNLSVELVKAGLSKVHSTAESSVHATRLYQVEKEAQQHKKKIWTGYEKPTAVEVVDEMPAERKVDYQPMIITEVSDEGKMYGQYISDEGSLQKVANSLDSAYSSNPPVVGSYRPKKGEVCGAKFVDGNWYRAKVEKVAGSRVHVFYVDFGNREITEPAKCAQLPTGLDKPPFYAKEMNLAFVKFYANEEDYQLMAVDTIRQLTEGRVQVNTEWKTSGALNVTVQLQDKSDLGKTLLEKGLMLLDDKRVDHRFASVVAEFSAAQGEAKKNHREIWRYGDITEDDDLDR